MVFLRMILPVVATLSGVAFPAYARDICPKYYGCRPVDDYDCRETPQSSFIGEACFSDYYEVTLIDLRGTWYAYCDVPLDLFEYLTSADSPGRVYNAEIKGRFDCD